MPAQGQDPGGFHFSKDRESERHVYGQVGVLWHKSVGCEVPFAPAQALHGWIELLLRRSDHALAIERNQRLLAFDARVQGRTDAPDAGRVFRVRAGSNQQAIHGPVVVGAECQTVVRFVVAGHVEWNKVRGVHKRKPSFRRPATESQLASELRLCEYGFPRGRIVRQATRYVVLHGNDLEPFMRIKRTTIEALFGISGCARWCEDEHEHCLADDKQAVREILGIEEDWRHTELTDLE